MGILDYSGPGLAYNAIGGGGGGGPDFGSFGFAGNKQMKLNVFWPMLLQFSQMQSFLGNNPMQELEQFKVKPKDIKKAGGAGGFIKMGNNWYDINAMSAGMAGLAKDVDTKVLANSQAKYTELKQQPMLATLAAQSEGNFGADFTKVVNSLLQGNVSKNLGQAAMQGTLNDTQKQASVTEPAAVAMAKYLQDYQQAAQGTLQGLAGLPQTTAFNPNILIGPQSAQSYLPGVMGVAGMQQQQSQFGDQMGFNKWATKVGLGGDIFGGALGGIFGAGFGGGGGGGSPFPSYMTPAQKGYGYGM